MEEALRRSKSQPLEPWLADEPPQPTPPTRTHDRVPVQDEQWHTEAISLSAASDTESELPLLEVEPEPELWAVAEPLPAPAARPAAAGEPPVLTPVAEDDADILLEATPDEEDDASWATQPSAPAPRPAAPKSGDEDLWRIVAFDKDEGADTLTASFEAALLQVDTHLESLVRSDVNQANVDFDEPPVEAIVEATIEPVAPDSSGAFPGDNSWPTGQTDWDEPSGDLDDWDFDEDDVAADPSNPDEAAKLRRQRLLRRAMENMGVLGGRPTAAPSATPAPTSEPAAAPAPAASEPPRPDEARLAQKLEQRFADVQAKRDHFYVLGVPQDATRDQVKTAFLNLAKIFHPDRLPPSLPHMAPKITAVFEAIREAYEVLYDDTRRKTYQQNLQAQQALPKPPASAPTAPVLRPQGRADSNADDLYKMGEVFFRKRDFTTASDHYDRAHALDPKPLYLSARAWAIYMDPARKADMAKAKQMMADAVRADPNCDRAHYQLGVIARVEGDMDRAERCFREAVRANPKHLEANQELRLIDMRKKNPPKKGGFFR
ncbi:molecular chaperone DnaJ [Myxococcus xanthus]|uniref:Molecular chaperone DnaJ n=2 Tax=Myxococcus xanthus TaxID=34 RepID=A0AAE6KRK4_MYXXA|nr:molecular chaperone DnaJ [Myxococcus xanthus]QDE74526.1 molecular chaperone DnaJ [Myxococcus xanthus]